MRDHRRPEQKSAGKGVFIATSRLGESPKDKAEKAPQNIIAIDGKGPVEHMVRYEAGVRIY